MNRPDESRPERSPRRDFERRVGARIQRKLAVRRMPDRSVWFGLGMMGLVGWSVVLPTLAGAALGAWLDHRFAGTHSWTLALMAAGLTLGCANAWRWVSQQGRAMDAHRDATPPSPEGGS